MFLLTDSTMHKESGGAGYYIMAWLPLIVIAIFAIRGIMQKRRKEK